MEVSLGDAVSRRAVGNALKSGCRGRDGAAGRVSRIICPLSHDRDAF